MTQADDSVLMGPPAKKHRQGPKPAKEPTRAELNRLAKQLTAADKAADKSAAKGRKRMNAAAPRPATRQKTATVVAAESDTELFALSEAMFPPANPSGAEDISDVGDACSVASFDTDAKASTTVPSSTASVAASSDTCSNMSAEEAKHLQIQRLQDFDLHQLISTDPSLLMTPNVDNPMTASAANLAMRPREIVQQMWRSLIVSNCFGEDFEITSTPLQYDKNDHGTWTPGWDTLNAKTSLKGIAKKYQCAVPLPLIDFLFCALSTPNWRNVLLGYHHFFREAADIPGVFISCTTTLDWLDNQGILMPKKGKFVITSGHEMLWGAILGAFVDQKQGKCMRRWEKSFRLVIICIKHCSDRFDVFKADVQAGEDLGVISLALSPSALDQSMKLDSAMQLLQAQGKPTTQKAMLSHLSDIKWADAKTSWATVRTMSCLRSIHDNLVSQADCIAECNMLELQCVKEAMTKCPWKLDALIQMPLGKSYLPAIIRTIRLLLKRGEPTCVATVTVTALRGRPDRNEIGLALLLNIRIVLIEFILKKYPVCDKIKVVYDKMGSFDDAVPSDDLMMRKQQEGIKVVRSIAWMRSLDTHADKTANEELRELYEGKRDPALKEAYAGKKSFVVSALFDFMNSTDELKAIIAYLDAAKLLDVKKTGEYIAPTLDETLAHAGGTAHTHLMHRRMKRRRLQAQKNPRNQKKFLTSCARHLCTGPLMLQH